MYESGKHYKGLKKERTYHDYDYDNDSDSNHRRHKKDDKIKYIKLNSKDKYYNYNFNKKDLYYKFKIKDSDTNKIKTIKFKYDPDKLGLKHYHTEILANLGKYADKMNRQTPRLKYQATDIYNISTSQQPTFKYPTWLGEDFKVSRGVDVLRPGEIGSLTMEQPQEFSKRTNQIIPIIMFALSEYTLIDTPMDFYAESVDPKSANESSWWTREIHMNKVYVTRGSMKVDYPMITYRETGHGSSTISIGYGMAIPFKMLIKNYGTGKYGIDKFIIEGLKNIAIGFSDQYNVFFFELVHDQDHQYYKHILDQKKKFNSYKEMLQFSYETFGLLNTDERIDGVQDEYPVQHLINTVKTHIRKTIDSHYPDGHTIGVTIRNELIRNEKFKYYNNKYSVIGNKRGTLRNLDNLGSTDKDILGTNEHAEVKIIALESYSDEKNPLGFHPNQKKGRWANYQIWPSYDESGNSNRNENENGKETIRDAKDIVKIDTRKRTKGKEYHKTFLRSDLNEYMLNDHDKLENAVKRIFMNHKNDSLFENIVNNSFGGGGGNDDSNDDDDNGNRRKENYYKMLLRDLFKSLWPSNSSSTLQSSLKDIRYALKNGVHYLHSTVNPGQGQPISKLPAMKDFDTFLDNLEDFFKDMGLDQSIPRDAIGAFKMFFFRFFINKDPRNTTGNEKFDEDLRGLDTSTGNYGIRFMERVEAIDRDLFIKSFSVNDQFPKEINNPADYILFLLKKKRMTFKYIIEKFDKWNIYEPFYIVTVFFEDQLSDAALFGTKNMCYKLHIFPTVTTSFNSTTLDASVQFKDNPGIKFRRPHHIMNVENIYLKFPPCKPFVHQMPKKFTEEEDYFKVFVLPCKDNLHTMDELHFFGFNKGFKNFLVPDEFKRCMKKYDLKSLHVYDDLGYLSDDYKEHIKRSDIYLYGKRIDLQHVAYKGGYFRCNSGTNTYYKNKAVPLVGPYGKFYR